VDRLSWPRPPQIVAISPHADDAEYGAGCLLAAHAALGHRVTIVLMTGSDETRVMEAKAAAAALGADLVLDPTGSDGHLEITSDRIGWLETQLSMAGLVLAPHPDDTHQDHRAVAGITATALRRSATALSWYRTPSSGPGFSPTAFFPVSEEAAVARRCAVAQHQTQAGRTYLHPEHLALKDSWFGWLGGHRAAEPFQVVRHQFGQPTG
jgi:LmbE family N-acetylglucosaminyl deacetylase